VRKHHPPNPKGNKNPPKKRKRTLYTRDRYKQNHDARARENVGAIKKKNVTIYGREVENTNGMCGYCRNPEHEGWVSWKTASEKGCAKEPICSWFIKRGRK